MWTPEFLKTFLPFSAFPQPKTCPNSPVQLPPWLPLQAEDVVNPNQGIEVSWPVPPFLSFCEPWRVDTADISWLSPQMTSSVLSASVSTCRFSVLRVLSALFIPPEVHCAERGLNPNDTLKMHGNVISFLALTEKPKKRPSLHLPRHPRLTPHQITNGSTSCEWFEPDPRGQHGGSSQVHWGGPVYHKWHRPSAGNPHLTSQNLMPRSPWKITRPSFQTPTLLSIRYITVYSILSACIPGVFLAVSDAEKTGLFASQVTFRNERHAHLTGHSDCQASFRAQVQDHQVDPNGVFFLK